MHLFRSFIWWFAGGLDSPYHTLAHCMNGDLFWIWVTITLDVLVAVGYVLIAYHWSRNEKALPPSHAKSALGTMRNIFAFCGICGYLFIPVKMVYPAWRLYDMVMVVLVFYTWRYALNSRHLKVIYTAIGQSKQLMEDLAKSQDESKRKSFFLNAISHDLRTPLNGILLQANLAEIHVAGGDLDAAQNSLDQIKGSIRATVDMLEGLLEYSRLESPTETVHTADFELGNLLREVMTNHHAMADRKSLNLTCADCNGLTLHSDRFRLERILNNLVGNAVKFTSSGSVQIKVQALPAQVLISVVDSGIGIEPDDQSRLFEEFFQVRNYERDREKGFGLGLTICHRLVQQLGGDITVQSTPDQGSEFNVVLPRQPRPAGEQALPQLQSAQSWAAI